MESVNTAKSYLAIEKFALNMGEGASKQSFNVSPGDVLQFDGVNVIVGGMKGPAPTLRTVISFGWIQEIIPGTSQKSAAKGPKAALQIPQQKAPTAHSSQPSEAQQTTRRTISTEEYGKEVGSVRGQRPSESTSTVTSSTTEPSRRTRSVVSEEEKSVSAVRAMTGAASPGKAESLGLMNKVAASAQKEPSAPAQYVQPQTRQRRSVVEDDAVGVDTGRLRRATATQNDTEISGNNNAGQTDEELSPATSAATAKKGRGATALAGSADRRQVVSDQQSVDMVIRSRRATPTQFMDDMTTVSNVQASSDPAALNKDVPIIDGVVASTRKIREHSSESGFTSKVTVGSSGDMVVPKATTSSTDTAVIMGKTASVSASDSSIYDPSNYLGLGTKKDTNVFQPIVANSVPSQAKKAATKPIAAKPAPAAGVKALETSADLDMDFGDEDTTNKGVPMVHDHKGNLVPARKASINRAVLPDEDIVEDDFSSLNDGAENDAPSQSSTSVGDDVVVGTDFLDTLTMGGVPWAKMPHTAKIQYIAGKRVGKRMVGGCNNLSILKLIKEQKGLPPSVLQAAVQRLGELKVR